MSTFRQLPLPFPHEPRFAAGDFLATGSNEAALTWLNRTADWPDGRLALWGDEGRGKTHLLRIWAVRAGATVLTWPPPGDDGAPVAAGPIAIDDADMIADDHGLLHRLNAAREAGVPVLLTGRTPPSRWTAVLPDLASRLRAMTAVQIDPPEDSLLEALLVRLLNERQMTMGDGARAWLLTRLPRTAAAMREAVARLDHISLAAGGRITRDMVADVVEGIETGAVP